MVKIMDINNLNVMLLLLFSTSTIAFQHGSMPIPFGLKRSLKSQAIKTTPWSMSGGLVFLFAVKLIVILNAILTIITAEMGLVHHYFDMMSERRTIKPLMHFFTIIQDFVFMPMQNGTRHSQTFTTNTYLRTTMASDYWI